MCHVLHKFHFSLFDEDVPARQWTIFARMTDDVCIIILNSNKQSSSSFGFSHQGSPQRIFLHQLFLSTVSSSVTSTSAMSSFTTSINLLFGLPRFLFPGNSILSILLPIYPSSFLLRCPYHLSLASRVFSQNFPTCAVPLMYSFLILSIRVTPNANHNIFNSATSISASCLFVSVTVSNPYNIAGLTATLYTFHFTLAGTLVSQITPDILLSNKQYQLKMWPGAFFNFLICLPFCVTLIANYVLLHTIWNNKYYYYFM